MKEKILLLVLAVLLGHNVHSQRVCGSDMDWEHKKQADPAGCQRAMAWEKAFQQSRPRIRVNASAKIIVPVVVHVVYQTAAQNVSDAKIHSQIAVLNEDFNRTNADKVNTPSAFLSVAGNANIEFRLAKIDPEGNATNGITRTQTTVDKFMPGNSMKYTNQGGHDSWDTKQYLNIWVCNLPSKEEDNFFMGYTQTLTSFPTKPKTDGIVINYRYFGRGGCAEAEFDKGRTTTHEVGHWLNLHHIWGADSTTCTTPDGVDDTPNQLNKTRGCPSFPSTDACTTTYPGIMFMNFMDYTNDACMNMFTVGQVERMRAVFDSQIGQRREMLDQAHQRTTIPMPIVETHNSGKASSWYLNRPNNQINLALGNDGINYSQYLFDIRVVRVGDSSVTANIGTAYGNTLTTVNIPSTLQSGWYTVEIRPANLGESWTSANQMVEIDNFSGSYFLITHPNPVNDVLKLSIKMTDETRKQQIAAMAAGKSKVAKERTYTVQLFSTVGNLVQQEKATGDDIDLSFEVSNLPSGTYFVIVTLDGSDEEPQRSTVIVKRGL